MKIETSPTVRGIGVAVGFNWIECRYKLCLRFWKWIVRIPLRDTPFGRMQPFGLGIGWNEDGLLLNIGHYERVPEVKP